MNDLNKHRIFATTLGDLLLLAQDRTPEQPALIFPQELHTYASLVKRSYQRARSLVAYGVRHGDHVGILMPNCLAYIECLFGCALIGAIAVPMNARYKSNELAYVVENADLKLLITTDLISEYADFANLLSQAFPEISSNSEEQLQLPLAPLLKNLVMLGASTPPGFISEEEFDSRAKQIQPVVIDELRAQVQLSDSAIMMYTSGTTANPKGCPLSHGLLVRNGVNMNRERFFLTSSDVFWAPLPMFHMAAILPLIACLDAGAAMASMLHIDAGEALAMMERERVTIAFPSFPTVTNALISHPTFDSTDLSKLRRINNVAPEEMLRRFQSAFPQAVQTGAYGLTEAAGVIAYNHPDESEDDRLFTCGVPFPGIEVRISDPETLAVVETGQRGEIWIRGYCVFNGYYKSPEKNAEAFHDSWFRTGDLGCLTETGAVCFHGRIKDMLKVGGENVAALEIESFLATHPAVQLAQVVGRDDERLQEVPVAFIELKPGATANEADLIDHCNGQLASFKIPREIYFVSEWPMSSTKVQKFRLKDMLEANEI